MIELANKNGREMFRRCDLHLYNYTPSFYVCSVSHQLSVIGMHNGTNTVSIQTNMFVCTKHPMTYLRMYNIRMLLIVGCKQRVSYSDILAGTQVRLFN